MLSGVWLKKGDKDFAELCEFEGILSIAKENVTKNL